MQRMILAFAIFLLGCSASSAPGGSDAGAANDARGPLGEPCRNTAAQPVGDFRLSWVCSNGCLYDVPVHYTGRLHLEPGAARFYDAACVECEHQPLVVMSSGQWQLVGWDDEAQVASVTDAYFCATLSGIKGTVEYLHITTKGNIRGKWEFTGQAP